MSVPASLLQKVGYWVGLNRLWLSPNEPVRESETTASVASIAQGKFITLQYTWTYKDQLQDGFLLIGKEGKSNLVKVVWIDSWHMGNQIMQCQGSLDLQGSLSVLGSYAAAPGPDWGWRIIIDPGEDDTLRIVMMNISPEGKAELAVEANYQRNPAVEIVPYKNCWPAEFNLIASSLRQGLGELALRIDHIGSTSVPGLAAKDVIDIQITVVELDHQLLSAMLALGYSQPQGTWGDHRPAHMEGLDSDPDVKDPAVDLIYHAAKEWAAATHWQPGSLDA